MSTVTANITDDIKAKVAGLVADLQRAAAFADRAHRVSRLQDLELPPSETPLTFGSDVGVDAHSGFAGYAARYAVLAMITAVELFAANLLYLRRVCERFVAVGALDRDAMRELRTQVQKEARKEGNAVKLIRCLLGVVEQEDAALGLDWLVTVLDMRNCLTHRGGLVHDDADVDDSGTLVVRWPRVSLNIDGIAVERLPADAEKGAELSLRFGVREHAWAPGQAVDLGTLDAHEIAIALSGLGARVAHALHGTLEAVVNDTAHASAPAGSS